MIKTKSLERFDKDYFYPKGDQQYGCEEGYFNGLKEISNDRAASHLATYIFDSDNDWSTVISVYKKFPKLFTRVLSKLSTRSHDT